MLDQGALLVYQLSALLTADYPNQVCLSKGGAHLIELISRDSWKTSRAAAHDAHPCVRILFVTFLSALR